VDQLTFATGTFEPYRKPTRREKFLSEVDRAVPWKQLCATIEPFYPKAGNGRPPIGLERMLRIYFLQHWFNLSDPGAEEALYDSRAMREFAGIDLGKEAVPDETTICKFRHLLERHRLGNKLFKEVSKFLQVNGFKIAVLQQRCGIFSAQSVCFAFFEYFFAALIEQIAGAFQKQHPENVFLVFTRIHIAAQVVAGGEQ
jgi:IS5 family transposase